MKSHRIYCDRCMCEIPATWDTCWIGVGFELKDTHTDIKINTAVKKKKETTWEKETLCLCASCTEDLYCFIGCK